MSEETGNIYLGKLNIEMDKLDDREYQKQLKMYTQGWHDGVKSYIEGEKK